ncbi:hypothetical protein [Verminephrobacter aporrectodeae]|uniref:hypothetical protein n=1 Tax=Verminephrobacter aporrectodeae TaxID=1110389 RepID=UPI002237C662|nr:hypothetical protein [Verminephrobacter aporrectodeae]
MASDDETLNLSYTRPATGENAIQDAAGNAAASFTDQAVVNRVLDTTAPVLGSATVHGDELVLTTTPMRATWMPVPGRPQPPRPLRSAARQ